MWQVIIHTLHKINDLYFWVHTLLCVLFDWEGITYQSWPLSSVSKTWDSGLLRCDAVSLSVGSWHVKGYGAIIFKDRAVLGLPYHDHKHSKCWKPLSIDTAFTYQKMWLLSSTNVGTSNLPYSAYSVTTP